MSAASTGDPGVDAVLPGVTGSEESKSQHCVEFEFFADNIMRQKRKPAPVE
jgi:hypothetical protein